MGPMDYFKLFFKNYTKFDGRSRRAEYWWPFLFLFLIGLVVQIVMMIFAAMGDAGAAIGGILYILLLVFQLAVILPSIAVGMRRLHDTDKTGWFLLLGLIPIIGPLILLFFFAQEGTKGPNQYGPDPKGGVATETFS